MLVKLAFAMQRLKKYLKNFCHDQQRLGGGQSLDFMGGNSCYEGGHRAHGGPPSPPTRENPDILSSNTMLAYISIASYYHLY